MKIFQVDAFTDKVFSGNPAAVVPLKNWPEEKIMQQIAGENNLSETAFFVPEKGRRLSYTMVLPRLPRLIFADMQLLQRLMYSIII